ncbi:MAG: hypothetical protein RMJ35_00385 [Phycisphaerales bacterium]|nr:hypothetical protein [Phycisphaerales bacterium]
MVILLPRLPQTAAVRLLSKFLANDANTAVSFDPHDLPSEVRYAPTGGVRVTPAQLQELHREISNLARQCGFPSGRPSFPEFDFRTAVYLGENPLFASGEALRDDVWSFVSIVMFPSIVRWRFQDSRERYLGGVRNTFQRLWMRARVLDRGINHRDRWGLIRDLTEDALVQILERPSIGADPRIARHLAEAWVRARDSYGQDGLENSMRAVTKIFRMRNVIRAYEALPDELLAEEFDELFARFAPDRKSRRTRSRVLRIPLIGRLLQAGE